jgi:hypothetical protein
MGGGLSVGYLADMKVHDNEGYEWAKEALAMVVGVLNDNQCVVWEEPEEFSASLRPNLSHFPYSWIHFLRRAYAWQSEHPGVSGDALTDAEAARIHAIEDDHPFFRENAVFLSLWEVTRVSLEQKSAIVFC